MNATQETLCSCNACPGNGCTCGCQQDATQTAGACDPQCQCGLQCQCGAECQCGAPRQRGIGASCAQS